jgi:tetratricopeptide (TPR) repeat protein
MGLKSAKYLLLAVLLMVARFACRGQEPGSDSDYQYALIEAIKQKNLGNYAEAVKLYSLVVKEKPDCDAAYYELGGIYLMSNQVEPALQNLGKAYELEYQLANVYVSQGRMKKAVKTLEHIENDRGFSEKVTLLKASVYESEEEYTLALQELEKVMVLFPEAIQFRIVAAELCMKSGKADQAAGYYLNILEVDSTNIFALTNLADYYRKKEDYSQSFKYLERSFESREIDARRKMAILSYYLSEEKYVHAYSKELEQLLDILIRIHPDNREARLMASDFYIQEKDYEKAYWHLKAFLDSGGGTYPAYMQAILLANASSLDEELIHVTGQALKLFPDSADIRFFRGIGYYQKEEYQALIENFDSVRFEDYSEPEYGSQSKMLYAEAWYRLDNYIKSDSLFESLIREEPDNYTVLNNFSYYLAERGVKLDRAKSWSRAAIENNPDNATFLDTYAWILFKMGTYEEAEKYIMKAMEKGGENDPEINEHAGDIQVALNSLEIARSYYLKAIILGGDADRLEKKIKAIEKGEDN